MAAEPPYLSVRRDSESLIEVTVASRLEAEEQSTVFRSVLGGSLDPRFSQPSRRCYR